MKSALGRILLMCALLGAGVSTAKAQTPSVVRLEQDDPSVTYQGEWYQNGSSLNSGGSSALTNALGATATINFNGTGMTWIGALDPWSGLSTVFLDGTSYTVDGYGPETLYQQRLFSVSGLTAGPHTLTIYVPHQRDGNAQGAWVWLDAFEIENGSGVTGGINASPGRTEQNSPAALYTGTWFSNTNPLHSGGSSALAIDIGSSVTLNFTGTGVSWIAYRDEWSGIAKVYVDGAFQQLVDTYATPAQAQSPVFSTTGLTAGNHTLTIEVTGTHNPNSGGSWIWVDAFDVIQ